MSSFSDADFQKMMHAAVRLGAIFALIGAVVLLPVKGWPSAVMYIVGALISTTGVWEWRRLMTAVALQMDNAADQENAASAAAESAIQQTEGEEAGAGKKPRMGFVLAVFFLRLGVTVAVLYVTLKYLQGSVFALAAGLLVGILALLIQALRLLRSWTV